MKSPGLLSAVMVQQRKMVGRKVGKRNTSQSSITSHLIPAHRVTCLEVRSSLAPRGRLVLPKWVLKMPATGKPLQSPAPPSRMTQMLWHAVKCQAKVLNSLEQKESWIPSEALCSRVRQHCENLLSTNEASLGPGWKEQPLQGGAWDVGALVTALRQCDGITRGHAGLTGHLSNSNSQITGRLIRQLLTLLISKGSAKQRGTLAEGEKVGR